MNQPTRRERFAAQRALARAQAGRRLYRRAAAGILASALIVPVIAGWTLMIIADTAHHGGWHQVAPIGFGTAWAIAAQALLGVTLAWIVVETLRGWSKK